MKAQMHHTADPLFAKHLQEKFKQWPWSFNIVYLDFGLLLVTYPDDAEWDASPVREYMDIMTRNVSQSWEDLIWRVEEHSGTVSQTLQQLAKRKEQAQ